MLFSNDYNQLKLLNQNSSSAVTYSSSFKIDDILNNNKSEKINFSKIINENFNSKRIEDSLIKVNNNCDKTVNQQDFNHQYLLNNSLYLNHHQVPSASAAIRNEQILHNLEKQQHLKDQVCCSVSEEQNFKKSEKMRRKNEKKKCSVFLNL
jgi:hypothetical protein